MIDSKDVTPGYYWVKLGPHGPHLMQFLWQRKPGTGANGEGAFAKGGRKRDPSELNDLKGILPGLIDRYSLDNPKLTILARIEEPALVEPSAITHERQWIGPGHLEETGYIP